MVRKRKAFSLLIAFISLILASCEKDPGEGGNSSISGKVYVREYNNEFTSLVAEYYAPDEDIYIIYGEGSTYNERLRTGPNGDFLFPYLRPGKYKLYVYSADSTGASPSGKTTVYREVEITKKNQTVDAGTIIILKN